MIAYDRLSQIIPSDLALANKALAVAIQQITGVPNMDLPTLAATVKSQNTNKGLPAINQQTQAVTPANKTYLLSTVGTGTGPCGTILTMDMLGTAAGWVTATNFSNTASQLNTMNTAYLQSGYQNVINCMSGAYDYHVPNPAYDPFLPPGPGNLQFLGWACIVPSGPGAGDYRIYATPQDARNAAIAGIIPACQTTINGLRATYPAQTTQMNKNFGNIGQQIGNEQDLQKRAGLNFADNFANLTANSQPAIFSFTMSLPQYGQDIQQGGTCQYLEAVADYNPFTGTILLGNKTISAVSTFLGITTVGNTVSGPGIPANTTATAINPTAKTITLSANPTLSTASANAVYGNVGGQAIIAVMRQGQNNASLNEAGVLTQSDIPLIPGTQPQKAALIPSQYTVAEAVAQIKI
jgi:hypothetical protein